VKKLILFAFTFVGMAMSLSSSARAEDSIVCDNEINLVVFNDRNKTVASVEDYSRYWDFRKLEVRPVREENFVEVENGAKLKFEYDAVKIYFGTLTSESIRMDIDGIREMDDGSEFDAKVYGRFPGDPWTEKKSVHCYYSQS